MLDNNPCQHGTSSQMHANANQAWLSTQFLLNNQVQGQERPPWASCITATHMYCCKIHKLYCRAPWGNPTQRCDRGTIKSVPYHCLRKCSKGLVPSDVLNDQHRVRHALAGLPSILWPTGQRGQTDVVATTRAQSGMWA